MQVIFKTSSRLLGRSKIVTLKTCWGSLQDKQIFAEVLLYTTCIWKVLAASALLQTKSTWKLITNNNSFFKRYHECFLYFCRKKKSYHIFSSPIIQWRMGIALFKAWRIFEKYLLLLWNDVRSNTINQKPQDRNVIWGKDQN